MEILMKAFNIIVFPGFLFCCIIGLWLAGIDRKAVARMQKRKGPPLLQPTYDFFKLTGKETIIPDNASRRVYLAAPVVGLVSLIVTALFLPVMGMPSVFGGKADLIVVLYLLTIPALAMIIGGSASGSPYAGVGLSREMVAVIAYELPLIIVLITVGKKVGMAADGSMSFSLDAISAFQQQSGSIITNWAMIPAALAMLLIIPCKVGSHPFDVAEAETEICEGLITEYSGTPLAIFKLSHAIKMFIMTWLFAVLFLGGLTTGNTALDALILVVICSLVTLVCMSFVKAITARIKVEQLFKFFWGFVTVLSLISMILVWIGL